MLTTLRIKNLALVSDLTLELQPGYNAITGETGAGKSILIGALNLVLGERAERNLIRAGADHCTVEAAFDLRGLSIPLPALLEEHGLEPGSEPQLVLKRVISSTGANRQYVNGSPTTLNVLSVLGQWLVDIHGPHDHQSLLRPAQQRLLLDRYGQLEPATRAYADRVNHRARLEEQKAQLGMDDHRYTQELDLLRFQVQEISTAQLQPGEDLQVEAEHRRISNAARLLELSQLARECLAEGDPNALTQLASLGRLLQELGRLDPTAVPLSDLQAQAVAPLRELQNHLTRYADGIDLDPARLQALEERLTLIQSLKRKYGPSIGEILDFQQKSHDRLRLLEQREEILVQLSAELVEVMDELWRVGQRLSDQRRKAIPAFSRAVIQQLRHLGFPQGHFDVQIETQARESFEQGQFASHGLDTIEFLFAPNPGEPPRPLRTIASSGEIARVMLGLKTVLAAEDSIPVLVFDEVDANIGGETAVAVGEKMRQIGRRHQVLCITHLAPVAASAAAHYVVTKRLKDDRTISEVRLLESSERVVELARMLGGQSDAARHHAQALLKQATRGS
jgi:DNA repair protein RecN (Recombination protein N)